MVSPTDDDGHALPPGRPPIRDRRVLRVQRLDSVWSCVPCPGGDRGRRLSDSRRVLLRATSGLDREGVLAAASPLLRCPDCGPGAGGPRVGPCPRGGGGAPCPGRRPAAGRRPAPAPLRWAPVCLTPAPPGCALRGGG